MTDNSNSNAATTQSANSSTLIEFPGRSRHRPAWRKELSERFREIQQRRAREAVLEGESSPHAGQHNSEISAAHTEQGTTTKQLGLVPQPDEPEMNPIVVNALKRIERARNSAAPHMTHASATRSHGPATAAARVVEEQAEYVGEPAPAQALRPAQSPQPQAAGAAAQAKRTPARADRPEAEGEQARASSLVVVLPKQPSQSEPETEKPAPSEAPATKSAAATEARASSVSAKPEPSAESATQAEASAQAETSKPQPRHIAGVIDEFWLERQGIELLPKVSDQEVTYDDRAPRAKRLAAASFDLFVVALLCAPFAAAIELTMGNWGDPRVAASMGGIVVVVLFLYQTCSVALAGRTWGMSLCSLHAVDATSARVPTTGQCVRRALVLIVSLATLGLGILYSLFDAEGRTAHDILSGTVVVKS
jgi:uncharacterized RDD family membrane protein YckC